jgi:hypothetical protein
MKNDTRHSCARLIARILPSSVPRGPNPPSTRMPLPLSEHARHREAVGAPRVDDGAPRVMIFYQARVEVLRLEVERLHPL